MEGGSDEAKNKKEEEMQILLQTMLRRISVAQISKGLEGQAM